MTVEQRLDQLEKRNKRLTVGLTMIAVTICAVVTMAACEPETDKQSRRNNQQAELNELSERHLDLKIKQARQTLCGDGVKKRPLRVGDGAEGLRDE